MKQYITPKQLNELSEKGKKRLRKWWKPERGDWVWDSAEGSGFGSEFEPHDEKYDLAKLLIYYGSDGYAFKPDNTVEKRTKKRWFYNEYDGSETHLSDDGIPLLSIGQMIEFIQKNDKKHLWSWYFFEGPHAATKDVCDILWEAVKEILNDK